MTKFTQQQGKGIKQVLDWVQNPSAPQVFRFFGFAGTGKEQPVSTTVQTPKGPRRFGDLKVGDYVLGRNGLPTKVTGVFPQGVKKVYRVTFRDGFSTRCGIDHLWQVESRKPNRQPTVMSLRDIMRKGLNFDSGAYRFKIPLCEPVEYETDYAQFDPYIIGVLIGDGWINGSPVAFSTPDTDQEIIDIVRSKLPKDYIIRRDDAPACPRYVIRDLRGRHVNRLREHLEEIGLRVTSGEKFIPDEYLYAPLADRVELLRGLMDTDGTARGNRISFSTKSERLANDVACLVQSLGGVAIIRPQDRTKDEKGIEYDVNVKIHLCPFHLTRKKMEWKPSTKNPPSRYIFDITEDGEEEQMCIMVDAEDNLYLTDNFIVTHNTFVSRHIAAEVKGLVLFAAFTGKAALVMRSKGCSDALTPDIVLGADQVIVGRNDTRRTYNQRIRELHGIESAYPIVGDRLICLQNNKDKGMLNGSQWEVSKTENLTNCVDSTVTSLDGLSSVPVDISVLKDFYTARDDVIKAIPWKIRKEFDECTYGYAITCHKSQGSQWDAVTVFDESRVFREHADKWLYTAITRAAESVTVVLL